MRIKPWLLIFLLCGFLTGLPSAQEATEAEPAAEEKKKPDFLRPSGGQLGIGEDEGWGLGTAVGDPTALYGPTRTPITLFGTDRESLLDLQGFYRIRPSDHEQILVEGHIDPAFTGVDLSYSTQPDHWEGALTVNGWVSSGRFAPFGIDNFEVALPPDQEPYVQMAGMGVEYIQPFTEDLDVSFGLNYAQYAFADELFAGTRFLNDRNGFPLTVSNVAPTERFLAFRVNGLFSTLNDRNLPTAGTKLRFGMEQGIDFGNSTTSFNRLETNIAHLFEMPGFTDGDHTFVVNLQAGTIIGDPPPVRAFHLGGAASVRGYDPGELASGTSFAQISGEYRHELTKFTVFDTDLTARAALFYDYATNFDTHTRLKGFPPQLDGKRSEGYGYGVGLQLASKFGLFRFDTAWNGQGRNGFYLTVGERF